MSYPINRRGAVCSGIGRGNMLRNEGVSIGRNLQGVKINETYKATCRCSGGYDSVANYRRIQWPATVGFIGQLPSDSVASNVGI
jgi:hypothetical protein